MGAFEQDGKIDAETFRAQLMTFGNKFSASEVDDAFAEFKIDDGQIDAAHLKTFLNHISPHRRTLIHSVKNHQQIGLIWSALKSYSYFEFLVNRMWKNSKN